LERKEKSYLQREMEEMEEKMLQVELRRKAEVEACQAEYD